METKRVLIVMGSRSDLPSMEGCMKQLDDFQVGYEVRVLSAHRTPEAVLKLSKTILKQLLEYGEKLIHELYIRIETRVIVSCRLPY